MDTARYSSTPFIFKAAASNWRQHRERIRFSTGIAPALAAFLAAIGSAQATTVSVPLYQAYPDPTGNFTDIGGGSGAPGTAPLTVTNQSTSTSYSSQESGLTSAICCAVQGGYGALASATGSGTSSAGLLKGMVSASASVSPISKTGSTSPYSASAGATYVIAFADSLTLTSTLAPGTPVKWNFTVGLDEDITLTGGGSASLILNGGIGNETGSPGNQDVQFTNPITFGGGVQQSPLSEKDIIPVSGTVGQVVSIGEDLNIVAGASASPTSFGSSSALIDALDTGYFYADPVTPGLELVSASGHDYATPGQGAPTVPEPPTWVTMLLGFAGLGVAASRSSRKRAAAITA